MSAQPLSPDLVPPANARPMKEGEGYRWAGVDYPRVTEILGSAPGQHLLSWYAKQASLQTAHWLLMAGMHEPDCNVDDEHLRKVAEELVGFTDGKALRKVEPAEALARIADWSDNMREPERYRDHKARIGSVAHHALYDHAIGMRVAQRDMHDYLLALAHKVNDRHEYAPFLARMEKHGVSRAEVDKDLAVHAVRYVQNAYQWIEDYQPDWHAVGLEAMVVNTDEWYAGTEDFIAEFKKRHWERHQFWPFERDTAELDGDYKTSKSLSTTVPFQLAAYRSATFIGLVKDGSTHEKPETDGAVAVHIRPDAKCIVRAWTAEKMDRFFDAFCGLNVFYRCLHDMPRAERSRKAAAPRPPLKTAKRECPF